MIVGKFGIELLWAGIGVGMILWYLEGVTSGPEEVDGLLSLMAISVDGNFSEAGTWVMPTMGTSGGTTIVDEVESSVAGGKKDLEEKEVYAC